MKTDWVEERWGGRFFRWENPEGGLGGWVHEKAIVQNTVRIYDDACVEKGAQAYGNTILRDRARITENARVCHACVSDQAQVRGNARVCGEEVKIFGEAIILGNTMVYGDVWVYENAIVRDVDLFGYARIGGSARLIGEVDFCRELCTPIKEAYEKE